MCLCLPKYYGMYHRQRNTFYPKGGIYCDENFLRYLNSCYNMLTAYHKLKTFHLLKVLNQLEAPRNTFRKISHLWGKGYFAAGGSFIHPCSYKPNLL